MLMLGKTFLLPKEGDVGCTVMRPNGVLEVNKK